MQVSLVKQLIDKLGHDKLNNLTKRELLMLEEARFKDLLAVDPSCRRCQQTKNLTKEHIIPRDLLRQLNIDVERVFIEDNISITCQACNHLKCNRLDFAFKETKELLIKYVKSL